MLSLLLLRHLLTLNSLRKMKRALKLSFYEQVLQKQVISELCETGEWNSKYMNTIKTAFSIWQPGWRVACFYMPTKDSFYLEKQTPAFHLKHTGICFLKFFPTEIHVTNSLQLCHTTETDTSTPTDTFSPKHTERAMASPQGCPKLSSAVLSLGHIEQSTHQPLPQSKEQTKRNSHKTEHAVVFLHQGKSCSTRFSSEKVHMILVTISRVD